MCIAPMQLKSYIYIYIIKKIVKKYNKVMNKKFILLNNQIIDLKLLFDRAYSNTIKQYYKNNNTLTYDSIVKF